MPVYRYSSFEEAQQALWRFETDAEYYRMLADLFRLGRRLALPQMLLTLATAAGFPLKT